MDDKIGLALAEALDRAYDDIRKLRNRLDESTLFALGGETRSELVAAGEAAASVLRRPVFVQINNDRIECRPSKSVAKS